MPDADRPAPTGLSEPGDSAGNPDANGLDRAESSGDGTGITGDHLLPVVGLGGSAGSIVALQDFFAHAPVPTGLAYVVVLHLDPAQESILPTLLQRQTTMPVRAARNGDAMEADHVYVIPPGRHLIATDGHLQLTEIKQERGQRVAVDLFFRSLAETHGAHATAIVLSGADGDGAIGLKRIKERGGLTIAQDPQDANHAGMPTSAINTGMVDWVLPVAEMSQRIAAYYASEDRLQLPPPQGLLLDATIEPPEESSETQLREVLAHLQGRTGHDFTYYKRATILRRISRRMLVNGLTDLKGYLGHLRTYPGEAGALLQDLLISVTNFFRDREAFNALASHIPELFRAKRAGDVVRVWCPACATGEEAYSMAMLLLEHLDTLDWPVTLQVFGCDLDEQAVQVARTGFYPNTVIADVSEERLRRFFSKEPHGWRVRRELREMVLFSTHDLLKDAPFSRMDLVSCRNLLIYLNRDAQARATEIFNFALKPGGLLFLGVSESVEDGSALFNAVDKKHRIYRHRPVQRVGLPMPTGAGALQRVIRQHERLRDAVTVMPARSFLAASVSPSALEPAFDTRTELPANELHFRFLGRHGPASLLVDAALNIIHLSENAHRFLQMPEGRPTRNLQRLIHPLLRVELRAAAARAQETMQPVELSPRALYLPGGSKMVAVRVTPDTELAPGCLLVLFEAHEPDAPSHGDRGDQLEVLQPVAVAEQLERELTRAQASLRATVEQHETSTEEFKASNEELQAMNEELRSAGEELETGREELQSVNEELTTVNAEFRNRVEELARANSDLYNLMSATQIATIFLDRALHVMRYTPSAAPLFNLIASDIGRPIDHLRRPLAYPQLQPDAAEVLRTLMPVERELREDGHWYLARVLPYRTVDDHIAGVVMTFIDITERRRVEAVLRESEEQQKLLLALSDAVRPLLHPRDIQQVGMRLLGEYLGAARAYYFFARRDAQGGWVHVVESEYRRDLGLASCIGDHAVSAYGGSLFDGLARGQVLQHSDVAQIEGLGKAELARLRAIDIAGFVNVPLILGDQFVAGIAVHDSEPRERHAAEIVLIREVAARLWAAIERARALEALRSSEERYRTLFDSMDEGYCILQMIHDADGRPVDWRFVQVNRAFEVNNGLADAEGRTIRELAPDIESKWLDIYDRVARTGEALRFVEDSAALQRVFTCYAFRIGDPDEHKVAAIFTDITAHTRAESALRESEIHLRLAVEASDLATWEWHLDTDEVIWNDRHFELFGMKVHANPVSLQEFFDHVHPDDQSRIAAELQQAIDRRQPFDSQFRALLDSGEERWMNSYGRVIEQHADGTAAMMSGVMSDVTERKAAEIALQASEEMTRAIADRLPGGAAFVVDRKLRYLVAGGEALGALSLGGHDFIGRTVTEAVGPELAPQHEANYRKALAGESFTIEHESHGRHYLTRGGPVRDTQGQTTAALAVSYDITDRKLAEDAVRHSEQRLLTLADAVPQIIWANNGQGVATYFNRRWYEYSGLSFEASEGAGWEAIVHPEDAPASKALWHDALNAGEVFGSELRLRAADGSYRWFIARNVPVRDEGEAVTGWFGTATDINDLKNAQEALVASEEKFRRAIEEAPLPVVIQADDGQVLQISRTWTELTGYGPEDMPTFDAWLAWAYGSGADSLRDHVHRLLRGDARQLDVELDITTRSGDLRHWAFSASAPGRLRDGRRFIVGMALDITERREFEVALRESRERLQLIVENAREYAIFSMDIDRRITSWNTGAEIILGYSQQEAIGMQADDIFSPADRAAGAPEQEAATALAEGKASDERWHVRKDGSVFWGSGIMTAMHDAGGVAIGLVKIFRDQTTELHAKEALEQSRSDLRVALLQTEVARDEAQAAGQAKDRFLAVLSHELRTPLTPLLLAAQVLARDKSLPPKVLRTLDIVQRNARLETHLVDDLLDVTRISTGKMDVVPVATSLHEIVELAVEVSMPDIEANRQRLSIDLAPGDDALHADVKRLQQVFWNLLKNASKFTPKGGEIRLLSRFEPTRAVVEVEVRDTGVGFQPDAAERIFLAFEQGNDRITREFGGLGLGLAIARAIVQQHRGTIRARSDGVGLGATFTVELPLATASPQDISSPD